MRNTHKAIPFNLHSHPSAVGPPFPLRSQQSRVFEAEWLFAVSQFFIHLAIHFVSFPNLPFGQPWTHSSGSSFQLRVCVCGGCGLLLPLDSFLPRTVARCHCVFAECGFFISGVVMDRGRGMTTHGLENVRREETVMEVVTRSRQKHCTSLRWLVLFD